MSPSSCPKCLGTKLIHLGTQGTQSSGYARLFLCDCGNKFYEPCEQSMKPKSQTSYLSYVSDAIRTESPHIDAFTRLAQDPRKLRLVHAMMGLQTETGELTDALKKHLFYGKNLDLINLKEEIGDVLWYLAILLDAIGEKNLTAIMQTNIDKLRARYPEKFTEDKANNRNLAAERNILEQ